MKIGSNPGLNQRSDLRTDDDWHEEQSLLGSTRFLILVDLKPVVRSNETRTQTAIRWFSGEEIASLGLGFDEFMFLGLNNDENGHGDGHGHGHGHYFAALLEDQALALNDAARLLMPHVDLRSLADQGVMSAADLSLIGTARSLASWHGSHRFCGHCGSGTDILDRGWRRQCASCGTEQYPRMDPVVIMLVTYGDRCLLARDVRFPETLYSTLAGYLEPGEDVEAAVKREVFEEVGLEVTSVDYKFSQPWPFPHSLMIGCRAVAKGSELKLDGDEIADAFWVDKPELTRLLDGGEAGKIDLPKDFAIANKLMQDFIAEG